MYKLYLELSLKCENYEPLFNNLNEEVCFYGEIFSRYRKYIKKKCDEKTDKDIFHSYSLLSTIEYKINKDEKIKLQYNSDAPDRIHFHECL